VSTTKSSVRSSWIRALVFSGIALSGSTLFAEGSAHAQATTFTVTKNVYDKPEWWGTITFRNNGPAVTNSYKVEFDLPAGVHCTAESGAVPAGATLSPLTGSGNSARTVSNHCVFNWASTTGLMPGQSKTFNYSADSQSFSAASNVKVTDNNSPGVICDTFAVTKNVYDGPEWWGTMSFTNNGPFNSYNYQVEFDVPAGSHCTNDYLPNGATLSPLNGTGPSARTVSNHCVYSWSNASPLAPGQSKTFNYSTDNNSSSFKSASNVQVSDQASCVGTPACLPGGSVCDVFTSNCCSLVCVCDPTNPGSDACRCLAPLP
jgi:hypothetical protein